MFNTPLDASRIKARAQGSWPAILAGLGIEACYLRNRHGPCPACGGKDRFRFDDREGHGTFYCNQCGSGDGFHLLERVHSWSFPEALQSVAHWLGLEVSSGPTHLQPRPGKRPSLLTSITDPVKVERRRRRLQQTWEEALPLWDRRALPARRYLVHRGLALAVYPETLRLHPDLPYFDEDGSGTGCWPALLAVVSGIDGQPVTLHRTYLTTEGNKAPVGEAKKLMTYPGDRTLSGGAIRLFPVQPVLGVTEGIETALAVHQATGLPIWPAVSATLLAQFQPPDGISEVLIWADHDRSGAGQEAAAALAARLQAAGLIARILLPPGPLPADAKGVDWLDILCAGRIDVIRNAAQAAG
ncbi:MAG: toprim domain-containing protein [Candidatus Competibacteraceae bacterium]